jgi:hypothetical protein
LKILFNESRLRANEGLLRVSHGCIGTQEIHHPLLCRRKNRDDGQETF